MGGRLQRLVLWIESNAQRAWTNSSVVWFIWIAFAAALVWVECYPPAPGVSIAILAVLAAIMTIIEMKYTQRILALIFVVAFLISELHSINHEKYEQESANNLERAKLQKNFEEILAQNQKSFDKTESRFAEMVAEERETIYSITGGDSFAYIEPLLNSVFRTEPNAAWQIPLMLWNDGNYPLTGITIRIVDQADTGSGMINSDFILPDAEIPSLGPHSNKTLKIRLIPNFEKNEIANYLIWISEQNGMISELLQIRKGQPPAPLAYKYIVFKNVVLEHGTTYKAESIPLKEQELWSDDIKSAAPQTTNPPALPPPSPTRPASPPGR